MRLTLHDREQIKAAAAALAGPQARVLLFGSRTRDGARGGDIDLLVDCPQPVARPVWLAARLEAELMFRLGERRIDVLLTAPNLPEHGIHRVARAEGQAL